MAHIQRLISKTRSLFTGFSMSLTSRRKQASACSSAKRGAAVSAHYLI